MRLERLLHDWECKLPSELEIAPGSMTLPAKNVILLHAQFQNCRLLLHRPLYSLPGGTHTDDSITTAARARRSESPMSTMATGTTNEAHVACTAAAGAIAHLVTLFKQHGWRSASPLFIYYVFSAGIRISFEI